MKLRLWSPEFVTTFMPSSVEIDKQYLYTVVNIKRIISNTSVRTTNIESNSDNKYKY